MSVTNKLKELRHDRRLNQIEFAEYLGLTQYQYNRYENQRQQPTLEGAIRIAQKLGMPVEHIFLMDMQ